MHLTIPPPVTVFGNVSYSLAEMAAYIVETDHRYNRSAEGARSGVRLLAALAAERNGKVDVPDADLRLFAEAIEKPARGWGAHAVSGEVQDPRTGVATQVKRRAMAPTKAYLPLIDAVASAAAKLPAPTT